MIVNELKILIQTVQRNWWIVALTAGAALLISIGVSMVTEPTYQTSARFIVSPSQGLEDRDIINSLEALDKRSVVVTYAEVLRSNRIIAASLQELDMAAIDLADYELTAVVLPEANVLELTVAGPDPTLTAALANTAGEKAIEYMSSLYTIHLFNFLDRAPVPKRPFAPQPVQNAVLSVALGLGLGVLLVIMRERLFQPTALLANQHDAAPENDSARPLTDLEELMPDNSQPASTNGSAHDFKAKPSTTK
jgi:receptor protein-tyrosine kinase